MLSFPLITAQDAVDESGCSSAPSLRALFTASLTAAWSGMRSKYELIHSDAQHLPDQRFDQPSFLELNCCKIWSRFSFIRTVPYTSSVNKLRSKDDRFPCCRKESRISPRNPQIVKFL